MEKRNYISYCFQILRNHNHHNMEINYILLKENDDKTLSMKAIAHDKDDLDKIVGINMGNKEYCYPIPNWDFNIDSYILEDLENDWNILYMPLEEHYGIWCNIDQCKDDIDKKTGLQNYLKYCKENNITRDVLSKIDYATSNIKDVMPLYEEINADHTIIDEITFGKRSVVLAYRSGQNPEYVTWRTTPDRKRGFDQGHYFLKYNDAYKDFKERCHSIFEDYLIENKQKNIPHKDVKQHER